jgi:hypothetical protein
VNDTDDNIPESGTKRLWARAARLPPSRVRDMGVQAGNQASEPAGLDAARGGLTTRRVPNVSTRITLIYGNPGIP